MNYGGIDVPPPARKWGSWQTEFLWRPKRIEGRWYWLRCVHYRFRMISWAPGLGEEKYEYQRAVDIFDLMQKDADEKI